MTNISVKTKLYVLGAIVALFGVVIGAIVFYNTHKAVAQMDQEKYCLKVADSLYEMFIELQTAGMYNRSLAAGDKSYKTPLENTFNKIDKILSKLSLLGKKYGKKLDMNKNFNELLFMYDNLKQNAYSFNPHQVRKSYDHI